MSFGGLPNAYVPDPYYDGSFQEVYEILREVCERIVERRGL
jgi:hypothetical protein